MALVTGGAPKTVGAFYDAADDRILAPPEVSARDGLGGGNCIQGRPKEGTPVLPGLSFKQD